MDAAPLISVVIPTYNRCDMLGEALDSVLAEECGVPWELYVVDNNSADATVSVLEDYASRFPGRMRFGIERRQGPSSARNLGIANTAGALIAFTDDDVRVEPGWLNTIHRRFTEHPDIAFIGGRIRPRWRMSQPIWMGPAQDGALALLDAGDASLVLDRDRPLFLPSANLAIRRSVLGAAGAFDTSLLLLEDNELQLRLWRSGYRGLYVPEMIVHADVQPERMTQAYHKRWARANGRACADLHIAELYGKNGELLPEGSSMATHFGAPLYCYGSLLGRIVRWMSVPSARPKQRFAAGTEVRWMYHYLRRSRELWNKDRSTGVAAECAGFIAGAWKSARRSWLGSRNSGAG